MMVLCTHCPLAFFIRYDTQSGCGWCPYDATVCSVTLAPPEDCAAWTVGGKLTTHVNTYQAIKAMPTIVPPTTAAILDVRDMAARTLLPPWPVRQRSVISLSCEPLDIGRPRAILRPGSCREIAAAHPDRRR